MPPYVFNCNFKGLCGFVLNKPLSSSPERARVLLPEGNKAAVREQVRVHHPMLMIPTANLLDNHGVLPHFTQPRLGMSVYFLSGLELRFDFHGTGTPADLNVDATPVVDPTKPQQSERTSFETIARLEKGAVKAKTIASGCLKNPPETKRVDARVKIDSGGKLFVRSLTQVEITPGVFIDDIWDFQDTAGTIFSQVLAEDVVLAKEQLSGSVNLIGQNFITGQDVFTFTIGQASAEPKIEVTVLNAELEGVFGFDCFECDPSRANDIKLLYRLSTAWDGFSPTVGDLPIPVRRLGGVGLPIHCPRASSASDPNA
jgi:hypothetical protein